MPAVSTVVSSHASYLLLVALFAVERGVELCVSTRNAERLLARGGVESGASHYPLMVAVHAGVLLAAPLEVLLLDRPFLPGLGVPMLVLLAGTLALRYWVVATLRERWCTRVIHVPGDPLAVSGPYRFLRHPNYAAVAVEVPALPLVHGAWLTAIVFGTLNGLVLRARLRVEDAALGREIAIRPSR